MWNSALRSGRKRRQGSDGTVRTPTPDEIAARTALLDLAPDAIFARDANRRITFWNRGAEETYGFSASEALGVTPRELLRTEYPLPLEEIERLIDETGSW